MSPRPGWRSSPLLCACVLICGSVNAGEPERVPTAPAPVALHGGLPEYDPLGDPGDDRKNWCDPDRFSLQILGGVYFRCGLGPDAQHVFLRPDRRDSYEFDYGIANVRLGYRPWLNDEAPWRPMERTEILLDLNVARVFEGTADVFLGPAVLYRYNFCTGKIVPYIQGALGVVYSDAHEDKTQLLIGQAFEFFLGAQAGVRWQVTDRWSLDAEGGLQHLSNGGLNERNGGLNTLGGSLGITYQFGCRGRR